MRKINILMILMLTTILITACGTQNENENQNVQDSQDTEREIEMERQISIGTSPQGSAYNTAATGLASVISSNSTIQVSTRPMQGDVAWFPYMNEGEIELGVAPSLSIGWALNGEHEFQKNKNLRVIVQGNIVDTTGYVVRKDSDIKSTKDLKGKRVAAKYSGNTVAKEIMDIHLKAVGLSQEDVTTVPVTSVPAGYDALSDRKVDAIFGGSPTLPAGLELDASIGLRVLNVADIEPDDIDNFPQDVLDMIQDRLPGADVFVYEGGFAEEPIVAYNYPLYLVASASLSEEAAYEITKTLWENYEELHPISPWLAQWNPDQMFTEAPAAPYHPGAIKFYKEKDLWTDEAEKNQKELLDFVN